MTDLFRSADIWLFHFVNRTLANPLTDAVMPWLTDWNRSPAGLAIGIAVILLLLWKGGKKGRILFLLMVLLIVLTDQISSSFLKQYFARPRPCHEIGGVRVVSDVRLLVDCGSGYSFPSSHAVNNSALALLLSFYYRRYWPLFAGYAFLMGISRIFVGVHFPSDVVGGAFIGVTLASGFVYVWERIGKIYPVLAIVPDARREGPLSID